MLTVTQLARQCGLSRSTVLYYESVGLLKAPSRTRAAYRSYAEKDLETLRQICVYRGAGLRLEDIRAILSQPQTDASVILRRRFEELNHEIELVRGHQRVIARLLQNTTLAGRAKMVTKEKWVQIMQAAGFSSDQMQRWHAEFEKSAPEEHQEFLEFLHIPAEEIESIREWSRGLTV
jgi:DNA-binding transcriptional MerR regulator